MQVLENIPIHFLTSSWQEKDQFLDLLPIWFELSLYRLFYLNILLWRLETWNWQNEKSVYESFVTKWLWIINIFFTIC